MTPTPAVRIALLGLAVGVVLADSSIVTIALPEILNRYDVEIETLPWALISFNLALALGAVPAALAARRRPLPVFAGGAVVFAGASVACATAPSFGVLVAARSLQGFAGAGVVCAALAVLAAVRGGDAPALRVWAPAGIAGAAVGPAAGGVLTQLFGWESIFAVQAPMVLAALAAVRGVHVEPSLQPVGRPRFAANLALMLLSGALVAALFLLALLLINGWRLEPLAAGLVLTAIPIAAILAGRWAGALTPPSTRATSGVILVCGGLAALGWLPEAGAAWTVPPQLAIGAGLGLALSALTESALAGGSAAVHGGWTIASRHAGVVLGLVLLTPIFTADLDRARDDALAAGTSFVLESPLPPLEKLGVAREVLVAVDEADEEARVPDVAAVVADGGDEPRAALAATLQDQLDRAVTNAFSRSFLVAALLGVAALAPILLLRRDSSA